MALTFTEHPQQVAHRNAPQQECVLLARRNPGRRKDCPILQGRKLRLGNEKQFAQGCTARERQHPEPEAH